MQLDRTGLIEDPLAVTGADAITFDPKALDSWAENQGARVRPGTRHAKFGKVEYAMTPGGSVTSDELLGVLAHERWHEFLHPPGFDLTKEAHAMNDVFAAGVLGEPWALDSCSCISGP